MGIISCDYFDPKTFFYTNPVDSRFDSNIQLEKIKAPVLIDENNYNFLVISDTHYYQTDLNYFDSIQKYVNEYQIEFVVVCGDITQAGMEYSFQLAVKDFQRVSIPVYAVFGNHDLSNNGFSLFSTYFGRTMYDFSFGDTYMVFLDTANGILGDKQKKWYKSILNENKKSNIFVFNHFTLFDDLFQTPTAMPYPEETYFFTNINDQYNIDYFITGHLHRFDDRTVRDVKYLSLAAPLSSYGKAVLFIVTGNDISYQIVDAVFDDR